MTVQTEVRPSFQQGVTPARRRIRGFVVGLVALAAAGTGIGIGVATTGPDRPAIVAPDSAESAALKRLHAETHIDPQAADRLESIKRLHAEGSAPTTDEESFSDAYQRLKDEAWRN